MSLKHLETTSSAERNNKPRIPARPFDSLSELLSPALQVSDSWCVDFSPPAVRLYVGILLV